MSHADPPTSPEHRPAGRRRTARRAGGLVAALVLGLSGTAAVAPHATAAPTQAANWTVTENQKPGTRDWYVASNAMADSNTFAGYTTQSSITPGQPLALRVNDSATATWRVSAYRLGWYQGLGGHLVQQSAWLDATAQPAARFLENDADGRTLHEVDADNWSTSTTLDTTGWTPGAYVLVLETPSGLRTPIPVVVRSTSFTGTDVIVTAPATWQAYNRWGGYSAYYGLQADGKTYDFANRSRTVTFNRPYDANGIEHFWKLERGGIAQAEKSGVNISYTTNVQVATDGATPYEGARAMVGLGHDEYWSNDQHDTYLTLRDHGVNLVFAGGNTLWWRIRYTADHRSFVIYKSAAEDPVKTPGENTGNWSSTTMRQMLGAAYTCAQVNSAIVVTEPDFFLFDGTGARVGSTYPGLLREEVDGAAASTANPAGLEIAAHSPYSCHGGQRQVADITYYTAASGAGVVDLSDMGFVIAMNPDEQGNFPMPAASVDFASRVFTNALVDAATGPMGRTWSASGNANDVLAADGMATASCGATPASENPVAASAPVRSGTQGDFTGDKYADLLTRMPNGCLYLRATRPGGGIASSTMLAGDWSAVNWMDVVADHDGDGQSDVLVRLNNGDLVLEQGYEASTHAFRASRRVGHGWGGLSMLTVTPDFTGDGRPDLVARRDNGDLVLYSFAANGTLTGGAVVGHGWGAIRIGQGITDFTGDGRPDLIGVRQDGSLWAYTLANSRVSTNRQVGSGWQSMATMHIVGDLDGDGRSDMVGIRAGSGELVSYSNRKTWWGPATSLGTGFSGAVLVA